MRHAHGLAAPAKGVPLAPWAFKRRDLRPDDVALDITYCGICHSDLFAVRGSGRFPMVPGHEATGVVTAVGSEVTRFKAGDAVVIGNIVDSCRKCAPCLDHMENACREFPTLTYDGTDRHDGSITRGSFSSEYVASERFVYAMPAGLDPARVAPLLCAGVTTWSPLKHWEVGPGKSVGIVGLGGLGHIAVKFAHALGARVVVFTTSEHKRADALALGADEAVLSTDTEAMAKLAYTLDFVLDNVSTRHPLDPYLKTLRLDGTLCVLGIPEAMDFTPVLLTLGRRRISSSGSAGTRETQEMLDFCSEHGIMADVEVIAAADINEGFARLERGDVRYRLVVDMATL